MGDEAEGVEQNNQENGTANDVDNNNGDDDNNDVSTSLSKLQFLISSSEER